jgi:hypothetical protein
MLQLQLGTERCDELTRFFAPAISPAFSDQRMHILSQEKSALCEFAAAKILLI